MEHQGEMAKPRTTGDDAISTPRIVNGLSVRRREKVDLWTVLFLGSLFLPDILLLLAMVPFGVRRILKYLEAKGILVDRPGALE